MSTLITNNVLDLDGNVLLAKGQAAKYVESLQDLLAANMESHKVVNVLNYHTGLEGGGGVFYWDASKPKSEHNGGTVIDPAKVFPTDWNSQTQLTTWFTAGSSGTGCWVRQYDGAVNVRWFGTKSDGVSDDSVVINHCYNVVNYAGKAMEMSGVFYTFSGIKFSGRIPGNDYRLPTIISFCEIRANLDNSPLDLILDTVPSRAAVYIGDNSSHGMYKLEIKGYMDVLNYGTPRLEQTHGVVVQSAAYGYYNFRNILQFDIGLYIKGTILAQFYGNRGSLSGNNLDICIMANQGVQGGLRHTNNQTVINGYMLGSAYKILANYPKYESMYAGMVGRNLVFEDINCEGNNYASVTLHRSDACLNFGGMGELGPLQEVILDTFWFEAISNAIPIIKTSSNLVMKRCFVAGRYYPDYVIELTNNAFLHLEDSAFYYGDDEVPYIVKCDNNLQVSMDRTEAYGLNDYSSVNIFDMSAYGFVQIGLILQRTRKSFNYENLIAYSGATDAYMTNGIINIEQCIKDVLRVSSIPANTSIRVEFFATDGGSIAYAGFTAIAPKGYGFILKADADNQSGVTQSNKNAVFPQVLTAGWFGCAVKVSLDYVPPLYNGFSS